MNKKNLLILADYLSQLPDGYINFSMQWFALSRVHYLPDKISVQLFKNEFINNPCNAVCCAIGHGPFAGFPIEDDVDWNHYGNRVFGIMQHSEEYQWCFSGSWYFVDDTAKGAAARIYYMLENGLPENVEGQLFNDEPLCYLGYRK